MAKPRAVSKPVSRTRSANRQRPVVGIDLGGTNMQIGVVDADGKIIGRSRKKTMAMKGQAGVLSRIVEGVQTACAQAGLSPAQLGGLGIGAPGAIDPESGVVLQAPNLGWTNVQLAKILRERLAPGGGVRVENDVNAAIYGEWKLGAGRGHSEMMGVWIGTGVGGGLVLNDKLYEGGFLTAGEIGHVTLFPGNPTGRRSVENNCSRTAIVDRLVSLIKAGRPSVLKDLVDGDLSQIKSKTVATAFADGDKLTADVVDETAEMLGIAIGGVVTLLSLKLIILGGGFTEALGEPFVKRVRKAVRERAFPDRCKDVEVVASELEDDAGLLGAAALAREALA